jgi:hypothetical protein
MEDLRYPIGKFTPKENHTTEEINAYIQRIENLPQRLENAVKGLSAAQLETPYRDEGWTVRQVVHHVADSHMNAYIRIKWMLTEETPLIKAYDEKRWAETPETKADIQLSLSLLKALHSKWVVLLRNVKSTDLQKEFIHPETKKNVRMDNLFGSYAWHGEHHLAHITSLKERKGW